MAEARYYIMYNPFTCKRKDNVLTKGRPYCSDCDNLIGTYDDVYMCKTNGNIYCETCAYKVREGLCYCCTCKFASTYEMITYDGWNLRDRVKILDTKHNGNLLIHLIRETDRTSVARVICYDLARQDMTILISATTPETYQLITRIFHGIKKEWSMREINTYLHDYIYPDK